MIDFIIGIVVVAILALAIGYIVRAKKRGVKCIGCSSCASGGGTCSGKSDGTPHGCCCGDPSQK